MPDLYANRQTQRLPFSTRQQATQHLQGDGFICVSGAWMRGGNEYAQIEGNRRQGIVVRIGRVQ